MLRLDSINTEQRLYVMPSGHGYTCYGFDVLDRKAKACLKWAGKYVATPIEVSRISATLRAFPAPGTAEHFRACSDAMDLARSLTGANRRCDVELTPELVGLEGKRVEVTLPDKSKARFWVGRSTGWMPIHLEIKRRDSTGGGAVYFPAGSTVRVIRNDPR